MGAMTLSMDVEGNKWDLDVDAALVDNARQRIMALKIVIKSTNNDASDVWWERCLFIG